MQTSYAYRPYAERGIALFQQPPRAVEMSGKSSVSSMEASNLGFIDSIIGAVSQATTNIANAFARGAEAGETTKQQVAASQAEIERAKAAARAAEAQAQAAMAAAAAQAQTAMSTSEGRMATVKAVAPWIGAAVLGVGLLFMLGRRR